MIKFSQEFGKETYDNYRNDLIKLLEGFREHAYLDGVKHPTIGYGFDLTNEDVARDVLGSTSLTKTQKDALMPVFSKSYPSLDALNKAIAKVVPEGFTFSQDSSDAVFPVAVLKYEDRVKNWLDGIENSVERAVLVSMSYNGLINKGVSSTLKQQVLNGTRAEAWFEIRYNSNGTYKNGKLVDLSNRRYTESDRFGLYDDHSANPTATKDEALQVAKMYTAHRITSTNTTGTNAILQYEALHNPTTNAYGASPDIYHELQPAIKTLAKAYGISSSAPLIEELLIADGKVTSLRGDGTKYDSSKNDADMLIGSNAKGETLSGEQGNDILVGNDGNDTLIGGAGSDILIGGTSTSDINDGYIDTADYSTHESGILAKTRYGLFTVDDRKGGVDTLYSIEKIVGTKYADVIASSEAQQTIMGGAGNDLIISGKGDQIYGGAGADIFGITGGETIMDASAADYVTHMLAQTDLTGGIAYAALDAPIAVNFRDGFSFSPYNSYTVTQMVNSN